MEAPVSFGLWLKERRKKLDMTQADLAGCAGCTVATIRKIEAEERRPSRQVTELLADCLHIPAEQRSLFLQVARGERRVDRLAVASPAPAVKPPVEHFLPSLKSNLPPIPTLLLGRERELAVIAQLLGDPQCRLLTLVGPGGIGKTRLALQAAVQQQAVFAQGAAFVSLAAVTNREQAITAIADALGLVLYVATDRAEQLVHALQEKTLLLVLDNFEHLLREAPLVALVGHLLRDIPNLKLLVTSREPLHLQTEWVFEVQGLPLPESAETNELEANSAAKLFLQRARQARVGFTLTPEDGPAILRICQLVEGLPLGIELAAAWVLTLSCREIAQEIEHTLDFLVTSTRDIPERHRSISAVFDHSWKLLSAEEQQVLRQLAIFQGGFGREAAAQVAGASLSLLSTLVSKSLLRRTEISRYDMHELVRQYALSYLHQDQQEYVQTRSRHCRYYTTLLGREGIALKGANRTAVVAELITEIANLRLAWDWATTHKQAEMLSQAADTLFWLYESRSNCREGVPLFGQAVQSLQVNEGKSAATEIEQLALGQALNYQGFFCFRQGQHPQGRELLQRSLNLLRTLNDKGVGPARLALSDAIAFQGTVTSVMGDYAEGRQLLHEGLLLKQALGDRWGAAFCLRQLGLSAYYLGEYAEAYNLLNQSLAISRELGNSWAIASSLNVLSTAAHAQGAYKEAQQLLEEGLALSQTLEDRYNTAVALNGLGLVSQALNAHTEAQFFFQESIALWREIGDQGDLAQTLNNLGDTLLALRNPSEARRCFLEALTIAAEIKVIPVTLEALIGLAALYAQAGDMERALELILHILQQPATTQQAKNRAGQLLANIESYLLPSQVEATRTQVQTKSFEGMVRELLRLQRW